MFNYFVCFYETIILSCDMRVQLSRLERTPDKREVGGSSPPIRTRR